MGRNAIKVTVPKIPKPATYSANSAIAAPVYNSLRPSLRRYLRARSGLRLLRSAPSGLKTGTAALRQPEPA